MTSAKAQAHIINLSPEWQVQQAIHMHNRHVILMTSAKAHTHTKKKHQIVTRVTSTTTIRMHNRPVILVTSAKALTHIIDLSHD